MSLRDFVNLQKIGEGSYSSVHKVRRISDNQEYALKKVKLQGLTEKEKDNALNEIRILASIGHPNMIGYKDAFFDENSHSLCIIMELADNGDLQKKIELAKKRNALIAEEEVWTVALHMLRGLKAMHSRKILHRDLKCANVFITKSDDYKIGDLNVSKVAKRGLVYTQTGTPYYASPEVWRDEPYDSSSDIWSLGCILYEMASLNPPFRAKDMEGLYKKVQKGVFDRIPQRYSNDLQKFIALCLQVSSAQRPSVNQLLTNPLLRRNTQFLAESAEEQLDKENTVKEEDLLNTIRMPKNPRQLKDKLPKAQYHKEVLNSSYDGQPRDRSHLRNPSMKMNRIQSVTSHRQSQYVNDNEPITSVATNENNNILPALSNKQQPIELPKVSSAQYVQIPDVLKNNNNNSNNRYDNLQTIVSDSRNYIEGNTNSNNTNQGNSSSNSSKQNINAKKRILSSQIQQSQQQYQLIQQLVQQKQEQPYQQVPGQQSQKFQNYNEDYSSQPQRSINSPTISVVSRKEMIPQQSPLIGQTKANGINQINSYARIANLYQKQSNNSEYSQNQQIKNSINSRVDQNAQYSRPVWWG